MKSIIYIIACVFCISCGKVSFKKGEDPQDSSFLQSDSFLSEPKIYLSDKDEFVNIETINRSDFYFNLSDKIIFSDEENQVSESLKSLKSFPKDVDLKIKASSFCSYKKGSSELKPADQDGRVVQELGADFYRSSLSISELLPQELFLNSIKEDFYCSFIFALKNKEGVFDYYNIAQQKVHSRFNSTKGNHKLYLVKETEFTYRKILKNEIIRADTNLFKVLLINDTNSSMEKYHLICEDLDSVTIPSNGLKVVPFFLNLLSFESKGIKKCRIFSENKTQITGMTNFFKIHFVNLKDHKPIDLERVSKPEVRSEHTNWNQAYKNGVQIPIHSWFQFENKQVDFSSIAYGSLEIKVDTQCIRQRISRREVQEQKTVVSGTYIFPFREKFPIMAVTPKQVFGMKIQFHDHRKWDQSLKDFFQTDLGIKPEFYYYNASNFNRINKKNHLYDCVYKMKLQDINNLENSKTFAGSYYSLLWTDKSYGVDQEPLIFYFLNKKRFKNKRGYGLTDEIKLQSQLSKRKKDYTVLKVEQLNKRKKDYTVLKVEQPFLNLDEDLSKQVAYLKLNFFDTVSDSFAQIKNGQLNRIAIRCESLKDDSLLELSWPYSIESERSSIKSMFFGADFRKHIQREKVSRCRVLFYENKMLRYFSKEMVMTRSCFFIKSQKC